nr:hypothetical protein [Tanacetum cinerariifolium]
MVSGRFVEIYLDSKRKTECNILVVTQVLYSKIERLARKNELKARGTLLMALPDKHQLKFKIHKDAKTLMEAIEKRFRVSAAASVSVVSTKIHVSALPNRTGRNLGENGPTLIGFDMSKVECYNCHKKGLFVRECRPPKDTRRNGSYDWSFQAEEEPTNYALMTFSSSSSDNEIVSCLKSKSVEARLLVYQQNETVFKENIKLLKLDIKLRDKALVVLREKFKSAEKERDDLKLKLEKFQTSLQNLSNLLASQTNDKTDLGYNTQLFTTLIFNSDDLFTFESDDSLYSSPQYGRYNSGDGYHDVPPPYAGTFMPPKPDFVFHNAPNATETDHTAFNGKFSPTYAETNLSHTHRPLAPIIEDSVSDSEDDPELEIP